MTIMMVELVRRRGPHDFPSDQAQIKRLFCVQVSAITVNKNSILNIGSVQQKLLSQMPIYNLPPEEMLALFGLEEEKQKTVLPTFGQGSI